MFGKGIPWPSGLCLGRRAISAGNSFGILWPWPNTMRDTKNLERDWAPYSVCFARLGLMPITMVSVCPWHVMRIGMIGDGCHALCPDMIWA